MNLKKKIKKNFDSATLTYDKESYVQKKCAVHLTSMLMNHYDNFTPQSILDVGTGTGHIIDHLVNYFPNAEYTLNDISHEMIMFSKNKFSNRGNFHFICEDIESSNIKPHNIITSNLCLQWTDCFKSITKKLYSKSNILAFSCLLDGTFSQWNNYLTSYGLKGMLKSYPNIEIFINFLKILKPKKQYIDFLDFKLKFNNPISLMRHLKRLGANTSQKNTDLSKLINLVKSEERPCSLEYKVIFIILENNNEYFYNRN